MIQEDWHLQAFIYFLIVFLFSSVWVEIRYCVVISIKVILTHISVKLAAIYMDKMQGWGGGGGTENITGLNGDEMSGRLELPSTGMCNEWQLPGKNPQFQALVTVTVQVRRTGSRTKKYTHKKPNQILQSESPKTKNYSLLGFWEVRRCTRRGCVKPILFACIFFIHIQQ